MAIIIGADAAGSKLKDVVKDFLVGENFEVVDVTKEGQDFVDVIFAVAAEVNKQEENLGIVIDAYGAGPFMVATLLLRHGQPPEPGGGNLRCPCG